MKGDTNVRKKQRYSERLIALHDIRDPEAALQLKFQQNARVLIIKLPDELLLEISLAVKRLDDYLPHWHQITHICRRWRHLVVDAAAFWTSPPQQCPRYVGLALERSKSAPLSILAFKADKTMPLLLGHMSRVQTLRLVGERDVLELAQTTLVNLNMDAPLLKSLWIVHSTQEYMPTFAIAACRPTAALRRLVLRNIKFDWDVFPLAGLTKLYLLHSTVVAPISGDRFVDAMSQMRHLQDLEICFSNIQLFDYPSASTNRLQMKFPDLTRLVICQPSPRNQCEAFLAQSALPRLQELVVDWETGTSDTGWCPGSFDQISRTVLCGNFPEFEELSLDLFEFSLGKGTKTPMSQARSVVVSIPQHAYNAAVISDAILPLSCRPSNGGDQLSTLVKITVTDTINLNAAQVIELFGFLPRLTAFGSSDLGMLTQALNIPAEQPRDKPLPFARLQSLEWHSTEIWMDEDSEDLGHEQLDEFCACIIRRSDYGVPIGCLNLSHGWISPEQRATLEAAFASVPDLDIKW